MNGSTSKPLSIRPHRRAATLVEIVVVVGLCSLLMAILLPAVQRSRSAARAVQCKNHLRQISLGCLGFESVYRVLPCGKTGPEVDPQRQERSWLTAILPYVERKDLYEISEQAYRELPVPYFSPPHTPLVTAVSIFACPEDSRVSSAQFSASLGEPVGLTSYVGVAGRNHRLKGGVLLFDQRIRISDILDGTSNTLLFGERPPSPDYNFGWWYTGYGQDGTGSVEMIMGVNEEIIPGHRNRIQHEYGCGPEDSGFQPGQTRRPCDVLHFWSLHSGGAHFALADGSVRFFSYASRELVERMADRADGSTF